MSLRAQVSWHGRWTLLGTLPVVAYGAYLRAAGLNPDSLWIDDAWVGLLAKGSVGDMLTFGSSSPPLFNAIVKASLSVVPDPELGAQLFPFVCGLLAIAAVAWAALELTRNPACAVFAALIQAGDPFAVIYGARVKQYPSDVLLSALTLALFCLLLRSYSRRRLWVFTAVVCVGFSLSAVSFFVVAALLPLALFLVWRRGRRDPHAVAAAVVIGLAAVGCFFGYVNGGVNDAARAWWEPHFLPLDSLGGFCGRLLGILHRWSAQALHDLPPVSPAPGLPPMQSGPIPGAGWIGLALCVAGAGTLWLRRQWPHLVAYAGLLTLVVAASAAGRFPLGGGRVELFLTPFVACLMASGLTLTSGLRAPRWRKAGPLLGLSLAIVQLGPVVGASGGLHVPRRQTYPRQVTAPLVDALRSRRRPGDALWTNLHGTFALAYYGEWPVRLVADSRLGSGFHPELQTSDFAIVDDAFWADEPRLPDRVFVFTANVVSPGFERGVVDQLRRRGFALTSRQYAERPARLMPPTLSRFDRRP